MAFMTAILSLMISIVIAFVCGKLMAKINLPAILGWLIAGIAIGPHALGILDSHVLDSSWFATTESILECVFGLMIGTEMIWSEMKSAGPRIVITTITESIGTFIVVSLVFAAIFAATGIPIYLAFMFGAIALATAPAPSLSVVSALKKKGLLRSLKNRGHDVYVLTTDSRKTVITIHSTDGAVYRLRYFIDSNYQKTFSADNVNRLINLI